MSSFLIGTLAMGVLCAAWAFVQRWITLRDPEIRGPESGCGGCGGCTGRCERPQDDAGPELPRARASEHPVRGPEPGPPNHAP